MPVSLPHTLTAGATENVNHVQANDEALRDYINGGFTSAELAPTTGAVWGTDLTLTTSSQDVPGASLAITPTAASYLFVQMSFGFNVTSYTSGADLCTGTLVVDGITQTQALYFTPRVTGQAATVTQGHCVPLSAAAHTIKLQAKKGGANANVALFTQQSGFTYVVFAQ